MRQILTAAALAALSAFASAATLTVGPAPVVTDPGWLLNGTGTAYATQALCIAAAGALPAPKPGASTKATCADSTTIIMTSPLPPPSSSGTVLSGPTSSAVLTDGAGTFWALTAGVVYEQPLGATAMAKAGFSANVIALAYVNGKIYQENTACQWYGWTATANPPWARITAAPIAGPACPPISLVTSPNGTMAPPANQIVDAAKSVWTLSAGVVSKDGTTL